MLSRERGLGLLEQCVLAEEIGRILAPVPFVSYVLHANEVPELCAADAPVAALLEQLVGGEGGDGMTQSVPEPRHALRPQVDLGRFQPVFRDGCGLPLVPSSRRSAPARCRPS